MIRHTVLTSGDKALGLGDGFFLVPTLLDLSKKYYVRHIATNQSFNILKFIRSDPYLKIYNMDEQGHYYDNDHIKTYNLTYWDYFNTLRGFDCHAINAIRKIAELPPYDDILPDIQLSKEVEDNVSIIFDKLKKPIVITQPLISYWTKMIDVDQYLDIIGSLIDKDFTVIHIGGQSSDSSPYVHPQAINLIGKTSIEQSMAMIKQADLFVGSDSFGQHVAAFTKTPAVVYWAGTSPEAFGYNFFSNITYPEIATCQVKCGR